METLMKWGLYVAFGLLAILAVLLIIVETLKTLLMGCEYASRNLDKKG